jgi:hypothetical protein
MKGAISRACASGVRLQCRPGVLVVDRVEAVVEREPVDELAHEVARVVVLAVLVAAVVLQEVHRDDAPRGVLVRDQHVEDELLPVEDEQRGHRAEEHDGLEDHLPEPRRVPPVHRLEVAHVGRQDVAHHAGLEKEQVDEVPAELHLRGAHHVLVGLRVLVVREVVPRHVGAHRVPVREREHDLEQPVRPALVEHGRVDRVVRRHRAEEREPAGEHDQRDRQMELLRGVDPLPGDEAEVDGHEDERPDVGAITKHRCSSSVPIVEISTRSPTPTARPAGAVTITKARFLGQKLTSRRHLRFAPGGGSRRSVRDLCAGAGDLCRR